MVCSVSFCGSCREGFYCFNVESVDGGGGGEGKEGEKDKKKMKKGTGLNVFCSEDASEQEKWIQALINCGASFTESQDDLVKDAVSLGQVSMCGVCNVLCYV